MALTKSTNEDMDGRLSVISTPVMLLVKGSLMTDMEWDFKVVLMVE